MKKKLCTGWLLPGAAAIFVITYSAASEANRVVVIPLFAANVPSVTSTGQVWMDRNLGALRLATKSADPDAYGSLFQWGRLEDGHEYRASGITAVNSDDNDVPGHGNFITVSSSPYDWRVPHKDSLWQGEAGINNPCPAGFRLPTEMEWETERASWGSNNPMGAFASPLKLVVAGYRNRTNGTLRFVGSDGLYWSSTVSSGSARCLHFPSGNAGMVSHRRAYGFSVRCIKD